MYILFANSVKTKKMAARYFFTINGETFSKGSALEIAGQEIAL